ncbi:MAG: hypothetical protein ACRDGM_18235 [bacterium]
MKSLAFARRCFLDGLRTLMLFNLPMAAAGVFVVSWLKPSAGAEDATIVVLIPMMLFYLGVRFLGAGFRPEAPSATRADAAAPVGRAPMRAIVVLVIAGLVSIVFACDIALSVPLFWALDISWAVVVGLKVSAIAFAGGVLLLVVGMTAVALTAARSDTEVLFRRALRSLLRPTSSVWSSARG